MEMPELYLIWSNEHGMWWRANSQGYTRILSLAGRYSRKEAEDICEGANFALPPQREPNEVLLLAPESVKTQAA